MLVIWLWHDTPKITKQLFCYNFLSCSRDVLNHYTYVNFYFRLEEIRILHDFCPHCKESTPIQFLEEFTKAIDTSVYCLAHIFTHLDFDGGIAGYGWTRELCNPRRNTAYTTFLNHNVSNDYRAGFGIAK